jgi:hypothetical protein
VHELGQPAIRIREHEVVMVAQDTVSVELDSGAPGAMGKAEAQDAIDATRWSQ